MLWGMNRVPAEGATKLLFNQYEYTPDTFISDHIHAAGRH